MKYLNQYPFSSLPDSAISVNSLIWPKDDKVCDMDLKGIQSVRFVIIMPEKVNTGKNL